VKMIASQIMTSPSFVHIQIFTINKHDQPLYQVYNKHNGDTKST